VLYILYSLYMIIFIYDLNMYDNDLACITCTIYRTVDTGHPVVAANCLKPAHHI